MAGKTEKIEVLVTPAQKESIKKRATENSMASASEFLLFCALNARISVSIGNNVDRDIDDLKDLCRLREKGMITEHEFVIGKERILLNLQKTP